MIRGSGRLSSIPEKMPDRAKLLDSKISSKGSVTIMGSDLIICPVLNSRNPSRMTQ